jgi:hypothetical protein
VPSHASELVDLVAGLAAEEVGNVPVFVFDDVHRERRGASCDAERVVLLRDAREKPRRVNAALCGEADEAARRLVFARGRDDIQWILERRDEPLKR